MQLEQVAEALSQRKTLELEYYEKVGLSFRDDYEIRKSTKRMVWFLRGITVYDLSHFKIGALAWFQANNFGCGVYPNVPFLDSLVEKVALTPNFGAPDPDLKPVGGRFTDSKGRLHRKDGRPALITEKDGNVISQTFRRGKLHSYGIAPSEVVKEGNKVIGLKWHTKGKLNRRDYPAVITYDEEGRISSEAFYIEGNLKVSRLYSFGKIREARVFMGDEERVHVYDSEGRLKDSYTRNEKGEDVDIDPKVRREKWQSRKDEFALSATVKFLESSKHLPALLQHAQTIMDYENIPFSIPYTSTRDLIKTSLHNGQFKLFLTELRFLTEVLDDLQTRAYMIYAGSAPSNKIGRLASLFPNVKFILVDPNEHYIMYPETKSQYDYPEESLYFKAKPNPRFAKSNSQVTYWDGRAKKGKRTDVKNKPLPGNIAEIIISEERRFFIIEDYFSDEVAKLLRPLTQRERHVYFVSDIRTQYESEESPREIDVLWNSAMMYNWLKILQPKKFMLKFRCPYDFKSDVAKEYQEGKFVQEAFDKCKDIPFIRNHQQQKFVYIKPEVVYMQAFAGASSTESRLVASSLELKEWDVTLYNNKYFYYNRIHRPYGWHDADVMPKIGIDRCGDCAITVQTFKNYVNKYHLSAKLYDLINDTLKVCRRNLFDDSIHGHYLEKYNSVKELVSKQNDYLEAIWAQTYRGQVITQAIKSYVPLTCEKAKALQFLYIKYPDVADRILSLSMLTNILSQQDGYTQMYSINQLQGLPIEDIFRELRTPRECTAEESSISLLATPFSHAFELESPELAVFLKDIKGTLVTLTPEDRVCGMLSEVNFFENNIFDLGCSTYIFFIQGLPFFLKLLLAERLKSIGSGHVFIEETDTISNDFVRYEKASVFPCTFIDRERNLRKSFVTVKVLSDNCTIGKTVTQPESLAPPTELIPPSSSLPKIYSTEIPKNLREALLNWKTNSGIIVAAPTGYGKTVGVNNMIAEAVKELKTKGIAISGVSVMPYRASIVPMYEFLRKLFPDLKFGFAYRGNKNTSPRDHVRLETVGYFLETFVLEYSKKGLPKDRMIVMVDEAHDASWQTDLTLKLLLWAQTKGSPIKLIVSSATINIENTSRLFKEKPLVLSVENKAPNVEIHYLNEHIQPLARGKMSDMLQEKMLDVIKHIVKNSNKGDVLVMLPGQEEISKFLSKIEKMIGQNDNIRIVPLHSQLPKEEIEDAIKPDPKKRKIILSTNIVENAITIEGLSFVCDSGLRKVNRIDASGIQQLVLTEASQSNLKQSLGRVGRQNERGVAYLMMTEYDFQNRKNYPENEAQSNPLFPQIMKLVQNNLNVDEILTDVPKERLRQDIQFLMNHNAIYEEDGLKVTEVGDLMSKLTLSIRAGHFLADVVMNRDPSTWYTACVVANWMDQSSSVFYRPSRKQGESKQDFDEAVSIAKEKWSSFYQEDCVLTFLNVWSEYKLQPRDKISEWCTKNSLFFTVLRDINSGVIATVRSLDKLGYRVSQSLQDDAEGITPSLIEAFKDSIYVFQSRDTYQPITGTDGNNYKVDYNSHNSTSYNRDSFKKLIALSRRRLNNGVIMLSNIRLLDA